MTFEDKVNGSNLSTNGAQEAKVLAKLLFLLSMLFSIEDNYNNYDNFFFNTNSHKFAVNFSQIILLKFRKFLLHYGLGRFAQNQKENLIQKYIKSTSS